MHRFYAPDIESSRMLPSEEGEHCVRVLRLKEGDRIEVVDGKGCLYECEITSAERKCCGVNILSKADVPAHWGCNITIAIAPTKNMDRMEWMVEKAVEMGVDRIVPVLCHNSERKVLKTDRLRKIAVSAMKQSLKAALPQIDELTPICDFFRESSDACKFIAFCDEGIERRSFAKEYLKGKNVVIMIGPEGDFSKEEIAAALDAGFVAVDLGQSRLRTETAGMFACAAVHAINQRQG